MPTPRLVLSWLNSQLGGAMHACLRPSGMLGVAAARVLPAGVHAPVPLAPAARWCLPLKDGRMAFSSLAGGQSSIRSPIGLAHYESAQGHASQRRLVAAAAGDVGGVGSEAQTLAGAAPDASAEQPSSSAVVDQTTAALQQDAAPYEAAVASGCSDGQQAQQAPSSDSDASGAPVEAVHQDAPPLPQELDSCWITFLGVLHDRAYFADGNPAKHLALANKRDVKKALQQLGRQRPDALFSLPPAALRTLAAAGLPEGMPHERKLTAAAARLQRSCIQGAAGDNQGASLQDMLRVVSAWARPTSDTDSDAEEAPLQITVPKELQQAIHALLSATLTGIAAPPDPAAMARARAATATPDIGALEEWADRKAQGPSSPEAAAGAVAGRRSEKIRARQAVNQGLAEAHKQRLARAAANKLRLVKGDWFCGDCGTRNYKSAQACVRCGIPASSLGCSVVSASDIRELESQGLLQPMSSGRDAGGAGWQQEGDRAPAQQSPCSSDGVRRGVDGRIKKPRWQWSERSESRARAAQSREREDMGGVAGDADGGGWDERPNRNSSYSAASRNRGGRSSSTAAGRGSDEDAPWRPAGGGSRQYEQRGGDGSNRGGRGGTGGREEWVRDRNSRDSGASESQQRWDWPAGGAGRQYQQSSYEGSSRQGRGGWSGRGRDGSRGNRKSSDDMPQQQSFQGRPDRSMESAGPSRFSERGSTRQWSEVREGTRQRPDASPSTRAPFPSRTDGANTASTRPGRRQADASWYDAEPFDRSDAAEAELARLVEQGDAGRRADRSRPARGRGGAGRHSRSERSSDEDTQSRLSSRSSGYGARSGQAGGRGRAQYDAED